MRRSLRIRDRRLTEDTNQNSTVVCKFCDHTNQCSTRNSIGPTNMLGEGESNIRLIRKEIIKTNNIDPREFLINSQDENLIYQPLSRSINVTHRQRRHFSRLKSSTVLVIFASVIAFFVNREYPSLLWRNKSTEVSSNTKPNFVNHRDQRLAHVNRNFKFVTQKLEALYRFQHQQMHDIQTKIGNLNINSKIEEALTVHNADKIGIMDYALESAGGYIISTPETYGYSNFVSYYFLGVIKFMAKINKDSNPQLAIQPGILPGECYAFKGQHGRIQIGLAHLIDITAITIEHTSQYLVESTNSAPKDFVFYGLKSVDGGERKELGCFTYKIDKNKPLQTFKIVKNDAALLNIYKFVEFNFLTNYGNPNYTCVYRVRVHGDIK